MKLIKISVVLLMAVGLFTFLTADNNEEFRATWVITWEHDCDSTKIKNILDNHLQANMNAVLFQVRQGGTAYYNSSFEPWGYYAGYQSPGFDPLEFVVEEAHKRGIEVHAWFNTFQTSSTIDGAPAAEHPDWVCRAGNNNPMPEHRCISPGLEEVRDYTLNVAMEIVNNYDIDGLHLDYIRWNEYDTGDFAKDAVEELPESHKMLDGIISPARLENLLKSRSENRYLYDINHKYNDGVPTGYSSWEEWWRQSVTEFVKTLHDSIQTVKPWVRLSTAALGNYRWGGWQGYGTVFQDAAKWYNLEYIDQLTPMHYHWTTGSGFYDMLAGGGTSNWGYWLEDSSDALFSAGPGSYRLAENNVWGRHPDIVESCRNIDWVNGFQFFSYGSWEGNLYWEEAGETIFPKKTKIQQNGNYQGEASPPPVLSLLKVDSLQYDITVTPDASIPISHWYAIYRSEDETIERESDEIIAIKNIDAAFTISDNFSGNQTFDGNYYYAATSMNRYWKESIASNVEMSEQIPSFPPCIVSSYPAEGDTIPVSSEISFSFSKVIDEASFESALSIEPETDIDAVTFSDNWYDYGKVVSLSFAGNLQFNVNYQVTLDSNLIDLNGVSIDGNQDGTSGDSFTLNFSTLDVDVEGPEIVDVLPEVDNMDIDCEQAINIIFDELIDAESVSDNTINLFSNDRLLSVTPLVTTFNNQSIVTIKSCSQLIADGDVSISFSSEIRDTVGNESSNLESITYHTSVYNYAERKLLDDFSLNDGSWWDPNSAQHFGIIGSGVAFGYNKKNYLPSPTNTKSGYTDYRWDPESTEGYLIRQHSEIHSPVGNIVIDTSYTLQCYFYGDGSNNQVRFALYEYDNSGELTDDIAEVSEWIDIDWTGWKLLEWDLGDENSVGNWISSDSAMDGDHYKMEGIQYTHPLEGELQGRIYFDNLRIVKKTVGQAPPNHAPVVEEFPDTVISQSDNYLKIYVNYTDQDAGDPHEIIAKTDTSGLMFDIKGHSSGSRVYIVPESDYSGTAQVSIIVRDYGIGELSDTTAFILEVVSTGLESETIVREYSLSQNYPNPFNPTTNIEFSVPRKTNVKIVIFDLLGRKVAEPLNSVYVPGSYKISFDGSRLASGVYIYQMITEDKVLNHKMMLLK